jgi:hypothetical protein
MEMDSVFSIAEAKEFSGQIQHALSRISSQFGDDINAAFQTSRPTKKVNEMLSRETLQQIEQNQKAITEDMRILHQSKNQLGKTRCQFEGFEMLGRNDFLDDSFDDESDSGSDPDEDIVEDSSHYDQDSCCDSDEESSLGSYEDLFWEMQKRQDMASMEKASSIVSLISTDQT